MIVFYPGIIPVQISHPEYLWWRPEAPVKHNYALVSYGLFSERFRNVRAYLSPTLELMGDSGAFQVLTKDFSVSPQELVAWEEENCDWGVPLDIFVGDFQSRLKQSVRNFEEHIRYAQGKCKFFLPIHGPSAEQFKEWWEAVRPFVDDYDGLAIPSLWDKGSADASHYSTHPLHRSIPIGFCIGKTDIIHSFAVGTHRTRLILLTWAQRYFKRISTDASSYAIPAFNRFYRMPKYLGWKFIDFGSKERADGKRRSKLTRLPCLCPACRMFEKEIIENSAAHVVENYIMEHHLYQDLEYLNFLDALSTDEELFLEYVKDVDPTLIRDIEFLECCAKEGFDVAYKKFGGGISAWG